MLRFLLPFLCLGLSATDGFIRNTGIFNRLTPGDVVVTSDGTVYLLNADEARVSRFDASGVLIGEFGSKGEGPGELLNAIRIAWEKDKVYVIGSPFVNVFSADGKFEQRLRLPSEAVSVDRVRGGWLVRTRSFKDFQEAFVLADDSFDNPETLLTFKTNMAPRKKPAFQPLQDRAFHGVSPDGGYVYLRLPESSRIHIYDTKTRTRKHTIDRNDAPLPVTGSYIDAYLEWRRARMLERGLPPRPLGDFPEYFPPIADMSVNADGHLIIARYTPWFGEEVYHAYDMNGREVKTRFESWAQGRVVAVHGDLAYITTFEKDRGEAGLAKVPVREAERFVLRSAD